MEDIRDDEDVEWGVLPHPPQAGPDSVVNALHFNLTRGESDTESVRTVLAEGYPEDPAEEDDVISERGLEGHSSGRSCLSICQERVHISG